MVWPTATWQHQEHEEIRKFGTTRIHLPTLQLGGQLQLEANAKLHLKPALRHCGSPTGL